MVKVASSRGGFVQVEVRGVAESMRLLKGKVKLVEKGADIGTFKAGNYVQAEVQESIMGNRGEMKSVDTGLFGNSIGLKKLSTAKYEVFPENRRYPNGQTVAEVAKKLEKGFSNFPPRRHFRNTEKRTKGTVREIIEKEIKQEI